MCVLLVGGGMQRKKEDKVIKRNCIEAGNLFLLLSLDYKENAGGHL